MKRYVVMFGLALAAVLLLAACGGGDDSPAATPVPADATSTPTPPPESVLAPNADLFIILGEQNESGQTGWAALTDKGDDTEVVLKVLPGVFTSVLVHIHSGSCGNDTLGPIAQGLFDIDKGVSTTTVPISLANLRSGNFAINSHKERDAPVYTTCGNIPTKDDAVTIDLGEENASGQSGRATLTARGSQTEVVLQIGPGAAESELVHIHSGACGNDTLGPVVHGLSNITDGFSMTVVDTTFASLLGGDLAINSHKKGEPAVYTTCGAIPEGGAMMIGPGPDAATTEEVSIANFMLPSFTVPVGTMVTWTNDDAVQHTTTSGANGQFDGRGWNSPLLGTGSTFSYRFDEAGAFRYTCRLHPSLSGTVTVLTADVYSGN